MAKNHSHCVIEDLCVSGLIKNRKLSKAISDSGWGEFRRQLEYKTTLYGSELVVADRFFASSKLCPKCGQKKDKLPLNVRVYKCDNDSCDWIADRDYTAAVNLLNLLGVANPNVMPVEVKTPKSIDEAGTKNQPNKNDGFVQLSLPLSNIV